MDSEIGNNFLLEVDMIDFEFVLLPFSFSEWNIWTCRYIVQQENRDTNLWACYRIGTLPLFSVLTFTHRNNTISLLNKCFRGIFHWILLPRLKSVSPLAKFALIATEKERPCETVIKICDWENTRYSLSVPCDILAAYHAHAVVVAVAHEKLLRATTKLTSTSESNYNAHPVVSRPRRRSISRTVLIATLSLLAE